MTHSVELAVFAFFTVTVIGIGLGLAFKRIGRLTIEEMFLGSRTLRMVPLALSSLASVMSSTGIIAFTAHYYAYGLHLGWTASLATLLLIPFTIHVDVPVLYRLKITSVFEYLRARYCDKISLTACILYFILTQSTGAISICAAAMAMATIIHVPFLWSCLAMGLTGTVYTTLVSMPILLFNEPMSLF
ncbi:sodium/iodide cotransporter-like [Ixodes scapularis]|uniref:sodium/iodide cotransporter-like n=1 Tax=Ixodes scapularis TaxID=6945 RepID=UPI001C393F62|nr:sodium/iodide cotransporter-like [Ixodes scapularis]